MSVRLLFNVCHGDDDEVNIHQIKPYVLMYSAHNLRPIHCSPFFFSFAIILFVRFRFVCVRGESESHVILLTQSSYGIRPLSKLDV